MGEMKLQWLEKGGLETPSSLSLAMYELVDSSTGDCTTGFSTGQQEYYSWKDPEWILQ